MKYYVRTRFYTNGKFDSEILLESEAYEMDKTNKETDEFDEYWDVFSSHEKALAFISEQDINKEQERKQNK